MLLSSSLPQVKENSKLESPKKDKQESTLSSPSPWESNKWLSVSTRWTTNQSTGHNKDTKKSRKKSKTISRRLVTTQIKFHSSPFQDGSEITC
jgi:hypothetical protein